MFIELIIISESNDDIDETGLLRDRSPICRRSCRTSPPSPSWYVIVSFGFVRSSFGNIIQTPTGGFGAPQWLRATVTRLNYSLRVRVISVSRYFFRRSFSSATSSSYLSVLTPYIIILQPVMPSQGDFYDNATICSNRGDWRATRPPF